MWKLHDETRAGKNICPHCNKPKEMYYQPWCPRCEKPKAETKTVLNFVQCLTHLEAIGHKGISRRMWDEAIEAGAMKGNDSIMSLTIPDSTDENTACDDEQLAKDYELLATTFNLKRGENQLFEVSW